MPSDKFLRAPMWCALSLALGLGLATPQVDAAGLGRLSVQSGLGQPLRAELEVTSVSREEAPTLAVRRKISTNIRGESGKGIVSSPFCQPSSRCAPSRWMWIALGMLPLYRTNARCGFTRFA